MENNYNPVKSIEVFKELYRKRFLVIILVLLTSVVTAGATLLFPNEYKSTANLFPNPNRGFGFDLFSEGGGLNGLAGSLLGVSSNEASRFYIILESISTKERVVKEFDLINVYETKDSEAPLLNAIDIFSENLNIESYEDGNFVIEFWDKEPKRAQEVTSFLIELLNERNTEISSKEATLYLNFIENSYNKSVAYLDSLTGNLQEFQKKYGVIELPTQIESYFKILTEIATRKYEAQIQLDLINLNLDEGSGRYKRAKNELSALSKNLDQVYADTSSENLELNFHQLPVISREYFKIITSLEIQREILKYLTPLYEQAKMDRAKSLPVVSVIDHPRIPELKDKPKRSLIVFIVSISSFIVICSFIMLRLSIHKNRDLINSITS